MKKVIVLISLLSGFTLSGLSYADGGPASIEDAIEGCNNSVSSISCDAFEDIFLVRVHCSDGRIRAASGPLDQAQCQQIAASAGKGQ